MPAMPNVLQMMRTLEVRPSLPTVEGVKLRSFSAPADVEAWLQLRQKAFADESPAPRPWTPADFEREVLSKPWYNPTGIWLVESTNLIGSVILARRADNRPAVNWLMVDPAERGRGIGGLLLAALELAVWEEGGREVVLETHAHWTRGVKFYRSRGYTGR